MKGPRKICLVTLNLWERYNHTPDKSPSNLVARWVTSAQKTPILTFPHKNLDWHFRKKSASKTSFFGKIWQHRADSRIVLLLIHVYKKFKEFEGNILPTYCSSGIAKFLGSETLVTSCNLCEKYFVRKMHTSSSQCTNLFPSIVKSDTIWKPKSCFSDPIWQRSPS